MPTMRTKRDEWQIDERLLDTQVAIDNSLGEADVANAVARYGYDNSKLLAAQRMLKTATELHAKQKAEYGDQYAATGTVSTTWSAAKTPYMKTLAIARVAFKNDLEAQGALMLRGNRKQSLSGWLGQTKAFYANLLNDPRMMTVMEGYGFTEQGLRSEYSLVEKLEAANLTQEKEKGEAQAATKARDLALDQLSEWIADYQQIASVALSDKPQLLEKLGFNSQP